MPVPRVHEEGLPHPAPSREAAAQVGKYLILSWLPSQSEADLCEAYDPALDRRVLLERLHDEPAWQDALALARLDHPYILRVLDVSAPPPAGAGYVSFALPGGGTLRERLAGARPRRGSVLGCLWQVGEALVAAHARGFVHRRLDAAAVMLDTGGEVQLRGLVKTRSATEQEQGQSADLQNFVALIDQALDKPSWLRRLHRLQGPVAMRFGQISKQLMQRSQRSERRKWFSAALAVLLAVCCLFAVLHRRAVRRCPPLERDAALVWSSSRASRVRQALARTGKPYARDAARRVGELVDAYLSRFGSTKQAICSATGVDGRQAGAVRDLRISCMQQQLRKLDAMIQVLEEADTQTAERAVSVVSARLSAAELEACQQLTQELGPSPPPLQRVEEVARARAVIGRGEALVHAGKFQSADLLFEQADHIAAATNYVPVQAEAALSRGESARRLGKFQDSVDWLHRAAALAESCRSDRIVARAWLALVWVVGDRQVALSAATEYLQYAAAAIHRCQSCEDLWPNFYDRQGNLAHHQGRFNDALRLYTEALTRRQRLHAPAIDLMRSYNSLGNIYGSLERTQEAIEAHRRAIALAEAELGPLHPQLAIFLSNLAISQESLGQLEAARKNAERVLDIELRSLGPDHPDIARAKNLLGGILMESGRNAEARVYLKQAIAQYEKDSAIGLKHPQLAQVFIHLGVLEQREGQPRESLAAFTRVLHIHEATFSATHLELVFPLLGMARAHIALNDLNAARPLLERARSLTEHNEEHQAPQKEMTAELWFCEALYRTLSNKLRTPDRKARHLAEQARAHYQQLGEGYRYEREEIDRFLARP